MTRVVRNKYTGKYVSIVRGYTEVDNPSQADIWNEDIDGQPDDCVIELVEQSFQMAEDDFNATLPTYEIVDVKITVEIL